MRINSIKRLRNCKVFRDFTWPNELPEFSSFNLIFGWNGSGKTTISGIFRDLELNRRPSDGEVVLKVDAEDLPGDDFPGETVPIRVFNRDFVAENVLSTKDGSFPLVLILGQQSIENQRWLEVLRPAKLAATEALKEAEAGRVGALNALDRHCVAAGRVIRDLLRGPGNNPYNNYDKSDYLQRAESTCGDVDGEKYRLDDTSKNSLTSQYRSVRKSKIDQIEYVEPEYGTLRVNVEKLASVTPVSQTIRLLKDDTELSNWVKSGLDLHKKRNAQECFFCENPLPPNRISILERHFNEEYEVLFDSLNECEGKIERFSQSLLDLGTTVPIRSQFYDHLGTEFDSILSNCEESRGTAKKFLAALSKVISEKKERPFSFISMNNVAVTLPNNDAILQLVGIIDRHNDACENHAANAADAGKGLEMGLVLDWSDEFSLLSKNVKEGEIAAKFANRQLLDIQTEIDRLEKENVDHRRPAQEFNDDLQRYLGHKELRLEVREEGYALFRNGVLATQLSEGETTAIGLLYFLRTLTDHRFNPKNGIIVLDDPISSLDANFLFLAFGFIQEGTRDAGQLVLLTHNFTFFRQVRNWFHSLKGQNSTNINNRPARFYMLICEADEKGRHSSIQVLDPLLERYDSDYHYLFRCIVRNVSSPSAPLESNYVLPNMARRLLEAFLAFRQPDVSGSLWQKMQNVNFDGAKKTRILRFAHTYSHNDAITDPDHDLSLLSEAPTVLQSLLELIKTEDPGHFERMMNLVNEGNQEEL